MAQVNAVTGDLSESLSPKNGRQSAKGTRVGNTTVSAISAGPAPGPKATVTKLGSVESMARPSDLPTSGALPPTSLSDGAPEGSALTELLQDVRDFEKEARGPGRPKSTMWNSVGNFPATLDKFLIDNYGSDWITWEPETLRKEIADDYATTINDIVFEKIMALRVLHSTQAPWVEWDIFQNVALALNDIPVEFEAMQYLSPAQLAFAVHQMGQIRREDYSDDVKAYIATILHSEGLVWLPDPLSLSQEFLDQLNVVNEDFKKEIQEVWGTVREKNLRTWPFKEDKLGVQLSRLAAIKLFIDQKTQTSAQEEIGGEDSTVI